MLGFQITLKVLAICHPEEVSILLKRVSVLWLCSVFERYLHERQKNRGNQIVA